MRQVYELVASVFRRMSNRSVKHWPNGSYSQLTSDSNVPCGTCYHLR